jgi:type IV pilus assembly protein PilY1
MMNSNLIVASQFVLALAWYAVGEAEAITQEQVLGDIAQVPLAACLTDDTYRSSSAVAVDPVGGIVYQAKFRATDWSGQLLAYKADPTTGILATTPLWEAGSVLPNDFTLRRPYSFGYPTCTSQPLDAQCMKPLVGIEFNPTSLNTFQLNSLDGNTPLCASYFVQYFAGSRTYEKPNAGVTCGKDFFSPRHRSVLLGDLVNSDPSFVGSENFNYSTLSGDNGKEGASYQAFLNQKSQKTGTVEPRPRMVYVGGNDGMLHGFEAGSWNSTNNAFDTGHGTEVFSFFPGNIINTNLSLRAEDSFPSTKFPHRYLVDGSPRVGDAYFSGVWHTVLLGTTGASIPDTVNIDWGGRSVFALDVTNPKDFSTSSTGAGKVLWEFTDNLFIQDVNPPWSDADLGLTLAQPSLGRMQNGKWAAIVANGYNSYSQIPVLYLIDISLKPNQTGFIIAKISPCDAGSNACPLKINGLSTPIAVDVNFDRVVDYIYAGDLQGNLWKFDVTSSDPKKWVVANNGNPLFVACASNSSHNSWHCDQGDRQPITAKPQVGSVSADQANAVYDSKQKNPTISVMVYFGTGKYLGFYDTNAVTSSQQQTFYALWDANIGDAKTDNSISGRSKLLQQTILTDTITRTYTQANGTPGTETLTNVRVTSNNAPCYPKSCTTQHKGWYMDLAKPSASPSERSVGFPLLINGNIVFTAFIPASDPCATPSQASSWLMELDAITGTRPTSPAIDLFGKGTQGQQPDGKINTSDMVTANSTTMAPSGVQSTVGILKAPAIAPNKGVVNKYMAGSAGGIQMVTDQGETLGRISWRQLR